ncbi:MAG: hypothetical protein ABL862_02090 [Candidatus Nitrotoga sp.]
MGSHLLDLPTEIVRSGLCLREYGRFCEGVPSEKGSGYEKWLGRTGPGFTRRTGLGYEKLMWHEHVNTVDEIKARLRFFLIT